MYLPRSNNSRYKRFSVGPQSNRDSNIEPTRIVIGLMVRLPLFEFMFLASPKTPSSWSMNKRKRTTLFLLAMVHKPHLLAVYIDCIYNSLASFL